MLLNKSLEYVCSQTSQTTFAMLRISGCSKKNDNVTYFIERERREHAKQYVISLIVKYL